TTRSCQCRVPPHASQEAQPSSPSGTTVTTRLAIRSSVSCSPTTMSSPVPRILPLACMGVTKTPFLAARPAGPTWCTSDGVQRAYSHPRRATAVAGGCSAPRALLSDGLQDKYLDGEIRVYVIGAHERAHTATRELIHEVFGVGLDRVLEGSATVQHDIVLAIAHEAQLSLGQGGSHDAHDQVLPDRRSSPDRASPCIAVQELNHRVRNGRRKHSGPNALIDAIGRHESSICLLSHDLRRAHGRVGMAPNGRQLL